MRLSLASSDRARVNFPTTPTVGRVPDLLVKGIMDMSSGRDPGLPRRLVPGPCLGVAGRRYAAGDFSVVHWDDYRDRPVGQHAHAEGHILVLISGLYRTTAAGAAPLTSGSLAVYNPPGTVHRDRFERLRGVRGSFLSITLGAGAAPPRTQAPNGAIALGPHALHLAAAVVEAVELMPEIQPAALEPLCRTLWDKGVGPQAGGHLPHPWLPRACELLRQSEGAELSVRTVARQVGVHPVYLARTFRSVMGVTPGYYLRLARLRFAAALLRQTQHRLAAIAVESGYSHQSHFTRSFSRHFGVSPGRYRKLHRAGSCL